ncbi:hypothetical protein QT886_22470 [Xanthomonas citri pv. citri]
MSLSRLFFGAAVVFAVSTLSPVARAESSLAIGPHLGINLDHGNLHLGGDLLIELTELSPNGRLRLIWARR